MDIDSKVPEEAGSSMQVDSKVNILNLDYFYNSSDYGS